MNTNRKFFSASLIAALVFSTAALALPADRTQNTVINADSGGEIDRKTGVTVFKGNVNLEKGSLKINADTLTVTDAENNVTYVAVGDPATMQQLPEAGAELVVAKSDRIEYLEDAGKILLIGNASIKQGGATTSADRLEYDIAEENLVMEGRIEFVIPARSQEPEAGEEASEDKQ